MDSKPDKYTSAYCIEQVRGFGHLLNGYAAEQRNQNEVIDKLMTRLDQMEALLAEDKAKIGELQARLDEAARCVARLTKRLPDGAAA